VKKSISCVFELDKNRGPNQSVYSWLKCALCKKCPEIWSFSQSGAPGGVFWQSLRAVFEGIARVDSCPDCIALKHMLRAHGHAIVERRQCFGGDGLGGSLLGVERVFCSRDTCTTR
jgi:hypothetical protein